MKSIEWARLVMGDQDLSAAAVNVACALALHSKKFGELSQSNSSFAQLSTRTHLSESTCKRAMRELTGAEYVVSVKRRNKHGKQGASTYLLTLPEPVDNSPQSVTVTSWPECHSDTRLAGSERAQSVTVTPLQGKDFKVSGGTDTNAVDNRAFQAFTDLADTLAM